MALRIVHEGEHFKVEFETSGGGGYYATYRGQTKGPFHSEEIALRHIRAKLEEGGQVFDEIEQAEQSALQEADRREAEGTLGSDAARAAEEARRAEDAAEMAELREEQARQALIKRAEWISQTANLEITDATEAAKMEALGAPLQEAVEEMRRRAQEAEE